MKDYHRNNKIIVNCIHCLCKLRVPLDKGKISVECPVCKKGFFYNPDSIIDTVKQIILLSRYRLLKMGNRRVILLVIALVILIAAFLMFSEVLGQKNPDEKRGPLVNSVRWEHFSQRL